jgi:hypothetical protein
MLALDGQEFPGKVRKSSIFPLLQVVVSFILAQVVLILAGHPAGMASHALGFIDDHSVSCHISPR